ncbi:MAG: hypothetical protein ACE147_03965 [Candidatus Methylomirabilales bacterium]
MSCTTLYRRLRGPALAIMLAPALAAPAMSAESLPLPPLAPQERGAYRARDLQTGEELSRAEWTLNQQTDEGRPLLHLREEGVQSAGAAGPTAWSEHVTLDLRGAHPVLTGARETRDAAGRPVQIEQRDFDYDLGSGAVVTTEALTGETQSRAVRLTGQTITTGLLPAALRLLPGMQDRRMEFKVVTAEGQTVGMRARVVGREWISVPAGVFDCFKVALELTGLTGALAALKLPPLFMWHTVAAPHFWVKYQGPEGSSPRQIVRELLRFETRAEAALLPGDLAAGRRAAAAQPAERPSGTRRLDARLFAYVLILAAVVFEIGVEAARLLTDQPAPHRAARPSSGRGSPWPPMARR